jgi:hypothetical protein
VEAELIRLNPPTGERGRGKTQETRDLPATRSIARVGADRTIRLGATRGAEAGGSAEKVIRAFGAEAFRSSTWITTTV